MTLSGALPQTRIMTKAISWFEIPATDLDRAQHFYDTVLAVKTQRTNMGGEELAVFPYDRENGATGGAIVKAAQAGSANHGTVVYLYSHDPVETVLERVTSAGGEVAMPRTELPNGIGVIATIVDTEGNHVGIHAMK